MMRYLSVSPICWAINIAYTKLVVSPLVIVYQLIL
jgi:hypothetical protein